MEDLAGDFASTTIDTEPGPSASGGGVPSLPDPQPEGRSVRDDVAAAFKADDKKPEPEAKPDPEAKEANPDKDEAKPETDAKAPEKPAEGDAEAKDGEPAAKPEEGAEKAPEKPQDGKRHVEPPKHFLPREKELWRNTPRDVQSAVERMAQQHEQETARFAALKPYEERAARSGTTIDKALDAYVRMEDTLRQDPTNGLKALLGNMELHPQQAVAHILKAYNIDPRALAEHIATNPQAYVPQAPQQDQPAQPSAEVIELRQRLEAMEQQQLAARIIDPFRAEHPRYDELQDDIAFFLQSGKIPATLSPIDRLAAAYDMAERINPSSYVEAREEPAPASPGPDRRADDGLSGFKSIKSAPGSVSEDIESRSKPGESVQDSLRAELRRLKRA